MITPKIVAHRGYAKNYPENTLEAFEAAIAAGVSHIELDVQMSKDGIPMIFHDETLNRTANREGSVFDLTADELSRVCVGEADRFGNRFASARLPMLSQLVDLLQAHPHVAAYVEVKEESFPVFGMQTVMDAVMATMAEVKQQCVIISYDVPCLEYARHKGAWPIGWVLTRWDKASHEQAEALKPEFIISNYRKIDTDLWSGPWKWFLYEITDPQIALDWVARGVEFLETMDVGALLAEPRLRAA